MIKLKHRIANATFRVNDSEPIRVPEGTLHAEVSEGEALRLHFEIQKQFCNKVFDWKIWACAFLMLFVKVLKNLWPMLLILLGFVVGRGTP